MIRAERNRACVPEGKAPILAGARKLVACKE